MARERITRGLADVVRFDNVSLRIPRRRRRRGDGTARRLRRFAGETKRDQVLVLDRVTTAIGPGTSVAIIGAKGPARRAFLRLAAGTLIPDSGTVSRRERILPIIDVARAMRPNYTVRQNIYLVGGLLGMTPDEVAEAVPGIVEECQASASLDKYLSSAPRLMRQKLAWSTSMATGARAYAIDQLLVVGEREFRQHCWTRMDRLREDGATFIVSSDSPKLMRRFCDTAILWDGPAIAATVEDIDEAIMLLRERRRRGDGGN